VATVTLVDPAGLAPLRRRFYAWLIACGLAALAPGAVRRRAARWLRNGALNEPDLLRFGMLVRGFRMGLVPPRPLGDDELRSVARPALLLVGERSAMHDAGRLATRARALVPDIAVEVVPGAGHGLRFDQPDAVHGRILEFLATAPRGGRRATGG
jgi:pimeloyl-ACP methyl ester carboxylesterase